ncbi:MAG: hypothetical protein ABFS12_15640 [Bacteroidota bacterium]
MSKNKFDIHEPSEGHFERFKNRLEGENLTSERNKNSSLKWYLAAASLALLISLWYNFKPNEKTGYQLADVSNEMAETQSYFTNVIHSEIKRVNLQKNEDNTPIINDALKRIESLENEYKNLSVELKKTRFDKRIINAMIFNFQQRIEILQDLLNQLDNIKNKQDENNKQDYV